MTAHLWLLSHAPTATTRAAAFPDDEAADADSLARLGAVSAGLRHFDRCLVSASRRTQQTAAALGVVATIDPALDDCDYGRWRGLSMQRVQAGDPQAFLAWMQDPASAPHGGESIVTLTVRVRDWLRAQQDFAGVTLAVTHPAVIRAAIIAALEAEPRSFWRIDVAPLSWSRLSGRNGRWNLVATNAPATDG